MRRTQLKVPARTLCPGDYPPPDAEAPVPSPEEVPGPLVALAHAGCARAAYAFRAGPMGLGPVRLAIRRAGRLAIAAAAALAVVVPLAGCGSTYTLPDRETPVEVWVESPGARTAPFEANLLVYVGDRKAVDGTVRLATGEVRKKVATLTTRGGKQDVSVVLGGRAVATETLKLEHRAWIVITITGTDAKIASVDREPGSAR